MTLAAAFALVAMAACSDDDAGPATATTAPATTGVGTTPPATEAETTDDASEHDDDDGQDVDIHHGRCRRPRPPRPPRPAASTYDFSAVGPIVQGFVDQHGLNGAGLIVVDRDDGVIHEQYWGDFGPDRISLVASSSKMITAGVLLRLQDDGLLDIDAPVAAVAPWGAGNPTITPAQLLSNSSGLVGLLPNPGYTPYVCQYLPAGTLQDCAASIFTTPDDDADIVAPDTEFRYGGAQWQVAGAVAEVASGKSWAQLIDEIYVQPCGLTTLGYNNHFTQLGAVTFDYPTAFNGDPASLQPTREPEHGGRRVRRARATTPSSCSCTCAAGAATAARCCPRPRSTACTPTASARRTAAAPAPDRGYGMGWWVDRASGRINDPGAYGSVPWLDLEDGYGAYLIVESDTATGVQLAGLLYDAIDAAVKAG